MVHIRKSAYFLLCLLSLVFSLPASDDLVFGARPSESQAKADATYCAIADLLSRATGQKVIYKYVDNWLSYQSDLRKSAYDIVFDGPAFIGWRMAKFGWSPLVKFPGKLAIVVIVKKDNSAVKTLKDIEGYTLCGFAPPNLATLAVQYEFTNPARQPNIIAVNTATAAYRNVVSGKCVAGIMNAKQYKNIDQQAQAARVVYRSDPLPNQAFSAGPKVTPEMREKISRALMSSEGNLATEKLRSEFKVPQFVPATAQEYAGLGKYLRDVWGFDLTSTTDQ